VSNFSERVAAVNMSWQQLTDAIEAATPTELRYFARLSRPGGFSDRTRHFRLRFFVPEYAPLRVRFLRSGEGWKHDGAWRVGAAAFSTLEEALNAAEADRCDRPRDDDDVRDCRRAEDAGFRVLVSLKRQVACGEAGRVG